jgi:hypothetical protein
VQHHRKQHDEEQETHGPPHTDPAEPVHGAVAELRQRDRDGERHRAGREHGERRGASGHLPEAFKNRQRGGGSGGSESRERQDAHARRRAIGKAPPERRRNERRERGHRHDHADLGAAEPGVVAQVEAEVGQEDAERAEVEKPEDGEGHRFG